MENLIFNKENSDYISYLLKETIDTTLNFKKELKVKTSDFNYNMGRKMISEIPYIGKNEMDVLREFETTYLPYCFNESSKNSMGFPDCGSDSSGMMGAIVASLLQQNLINQTQSSPSITFAEINVIRWMREIVGYQVKSKEKINSVFDVGGIVTPGGTSSNTIAMMLARENMNPSTLQEGISNLDKHVVLIPDCISHYSIKSSLMWIGCGAKVKKVKTKNFKYDLKDLKKKLIENNEKVMAVVAYVGDSRTMTVDNLKEIHNIVKNHDENIWLHADACHGFSLGFSDKLSHKIEGIELFDSISTDPHKVLMLPYTLSILLIKKEDNFKLVKTESDLIMNEPFAFGQITPFIGSKGAYSLKLWFLIKHLGKNGIANIIEKRHGLALEFYEKLKNNDEFIVLNKVDINSVMFLIKPYKKASIQEANDFTKKIYEILLKEGKYFLHHFPIDIPDNAYNYRGKFYPLRFMSGNPDLKSEDLENIISYLIEKVKDYGKQNV